MTPIGASETGSARRAGGADEPSRNPRRPSPSTLPKWLDGPLPGPSGGASAVDYKTDPELRLAPGFRTPEVWVAQPEAAGFSRIEIVPDVRVLRQFYPRFATGAVCGVASR